MTATQLQSVKIFRTDTLVVVQLTQKIVPLIQNVLEGDVCNKSTSAEIHH